MRLAPTSAKAVAGSGVHILSVGARTAVGLTAPATAAAVRAGISALRRHSHIVDGTGEMMRLAFDAVIADDRSGAARMLELSLMPLAETTEPLQGTGIDVKSVPLYVGLPEPRPGWQGHDAEGFLRLVNANGFGAKAARPFLAGHAAAFAALAAAFSDVSSGAVPLALVLGVDSYIDSETLEWLEDQHRLTTDAETRSTFIPGEGAGAVLLASTSTLKSLRLPSLGRVIGVATSREPTAGNADAVSTGDGLTAAFKALAANLQLPEQKIGTSICDINGERHRNEEFAYAGMRSYQAFVDANRFEAPADCWGDVGAASGALFCVLAFEAGRAVRRSPLLSWCAENPYFMMWASSDGGLRAAATLEVPLT